MPSRDLTFMDEVSIRGKANTKGHSINTSRTVESGQVFDHSMTASPSQEKYAEFLDVSPEDVIASHSLWTFMDNWWGTPYLFGGTSHRGIDCSAFSQTLYEKVFAVRSLGRTAQEQFNQTERIKNPKDLETGDLVFFKIRSSRVTHVGVYLQNNKFANASSSLGVTISDLTDPYWRRYFVGGGRVHN